METNLKKLLPLAGVVLGCVSAFAADNTQSSSNNNGMMMNRSTDDEETFRVITPNAGPRVENGADVFLTADFIYWVVHQDGLGYARSGVYSAAAADGSAGTSPVVAPAGKGHTRYIDAEFNPGFKVGAGLDLGHDGWDVFLEYTWLHSNHSSSTAVGVDSGETLTATWDVGNFLNVNDTIAGPQGFQNASANWSVRFNNFDLSMGRNYYISQYLTLRPFFGFKGAWYNQNYRVTYANFLGTFGTDVASAKMRFNQQYWGFGLRTGLNTSWFFTKNWSIFGDMALAGLWGQFEVKRKDSVNLPATSTIAAEGSYAVDNTKTSFHTIKPVIELAMGLRYDYWFSDDEYHFGLQAGWEEQIWVNQNQFFFLGEDSVTRGDLSFQGLTIQVRFDF